MFQWQTLGLGKRQFKFLTAVILSILMFGMVVMPVAAEPKPGKTVSASAKLAYNLKGLKHNLAVQKAYIASKYVYVTQRTKSTVYLSRLLISGNDATYVDEMTVTNAGHGQTLDMYTYNGINYLYFSSKSDGVEPNFWSLQVARLQYSPGKTVNYTDLHRFTYMNYATDTGGRIGETHRVDGGGNSTYTFFRVQTKEKLVTWSIYDTVKLNKLLDSNEQVQMNDKAVVAACVASFTQYDENIIRPNNSFQGADMLGKTEIYTSGGKAGETPQIALISNTGAYKTLVKITNVGNHEIEGVQTKDNNVYFTIVPDPDNKKDTQKIYYVPDSVFK